MASYQQQRRSISGSKHSMAAKNNISGCKQSSVALISISGGVIALLSSAAWQRRLALW